MTKFEELLQQINRQHVYIQTHNFPDPDAIASAYGLKRLLATRGIEASICYKGKIDRYGTGRLCEILDIELLNVEDLTEVLTDEDEVILVDSQKGIPTSSILREMRSSASTIILTMISVSTGFRTSAPRSGRAQR